MVLVLRRNVAHASGEKVASVRLSCRSRGKIALHAAVSNEK